MNLYGKTVLITGGSRGLGLNIARTAVDRGARVAICARDEAELHAARDELLRRGGDVLAVQCDVTSSAQVSGMIDGVLNHFGSIDVLINNAGTISVGPLDSLTLEDFEKAMQLHFSAPLYATFAVLPHMRLRKSGRIVNISSIGGRVAVPHLIPYCASKFALVGLSESLRAELTKEGIYVTTVAPGLIRTGSPRHVNVKGQYQKEYAWFVTADVSPLLSAEPRRLAGKILDAASTGQVELIMPVTAKIGAKMHGMFPSLTSELASLANLLLPEPGGIGTRSVKGSESDSKMVPAAVRRRNMEAGMENNQFSGEVGI
jgi:NAD(P)-dependent dehydrogenase (short-subunit alcohol dehydrogenase family)